MYKSYAALIGALIAVMISFNGILAGYIGDYYSTVIIHIVGLIAVSLILIIKKRKINISKDIPKYLFSAGAIGVFIVVFNNICFKQLGAALTLAIGLLGQSVTAVIIDHYGVLGMRENKFKIQKALGFVVISIGIVIMVLY